MIAREQMGMVDRGAQLDWLSQYPEEKEILLPPLTGMEVQADEMTADQVRTLTIRLNINLRSTTLEQLLAARQKELGELASMADKVSHVLYDHHSPPKRCAQIDHPLLISGRVYFRDINDSAILELMLLLSTGPARTAQGGRCTAATGGGRAAGARDRGGRPHDLQREWAVRRGHRGCSRPGAGR